MKVNDTNGEVAFAKVKGGIGIGIGEYSRELPVNVWWELLPEGQGH